MLADFLVELCELFLELVEGSLEPLIFLVLPGRTELVQPVVHFLKLRPKIVVENAEVVGQCQEPLWIRVDFWLCHKRGGLLFGGFHLRPGTQSLSGFGQPCGRGHGIGPKHDQLSRTILIREDCPVRLGYFGSRKIVEKVH